MAKAARKTLRDEIAMVALQALIMGRSWDKGLFGSNLMPVWAKASYELADEMLQARKKKREQTND